MRQALFGVFLLSLFASVHSRGLAKSCRELLSCAVRKNCIKVSWLKNRFSNKYITSQFYDDLAETGIDYGCIFNTGCNEQCNACPLCFNSKLQLTDVLSGENSAGDCNELVDCAINCIAKAGAEGKKIINCLLHGCAYNCFNGGCNKCSAFTTRVFNQACVTADFRSIVKNFQGQCHEMFRTIVYNKFKPQFDAAGIPPVIGHINE